MLGKKLVLLLAVLLTIVSIAIPAVVASGSGAGTGYYETTGDYQGGSYSSNSNFASFYETPKPTPTPEPSLKLDTISPLPTLPSEESQAENNGNTSVLSNLTNTTEEDLNLTSQEDNYSLLGKYESLGDIIKAGDWAALDEYKEKEKENNADLLKETSSEIVSSNQGRWNSYFNPPQTYIISCCGS